MNTLLIWVGEGRREGRGARKRTAKRKRGRRCGQAADKREAVWADAAEKLGHFGCLKKPTLSSESNLKSHPKFAIVGPLVIVSSWKVFDRRRQLTQLTARLEDRNCPV